ncbi:MAG: tetratricopeptide repeat protein [Trueperella sp.]|nr:tetratricopeptide repeat protein [Trueperella sp.]
MNNEPHLDNDDALDIDDFSDIDATAIATPESPARTARKLRLRSRRPRRQPSADAGAPQPGLINKLTYVLVALLAAAIVIIVWQSGRGNPAATEMPANHPDISELTADSVPELDTKRVAELEAVLADSADDVAALKDLGKVYFDALRYQDAAQYFGKAAELAPNDIEVHLMAGVTEFSLNNYDKAENYWQRATEIDPNKAEPWYNLGFIYLMREPIDNAKLDSAWDKVVELAPGSDMAQTVRDYRAEHREAPSPASEPAG